MAEMSAPRFLGDRARPEFPKRVVITGGMPYGNKDLHFGHVGGVFVPADIFARFLRDRIGKENVVFVSGTDCYGSPIVEAYREAMAQDEFSGSLENFVRFNYRRQCETLAAYHIAPTLFAASGLDRFAEIHREFGALILETLHAHGHLEKRTTLQFYDAERETFLNGRQVLGRCPVADCTAENAYADECGMGHQYEPKDLIDPKSTLTGQRPEMRDVTNWYLNIPAFRDTLSRWVAEVEKAGDWRSFIVRIMLEHFEPPTIHVTRDQIEALDAVASLLPAHRRQEGRAKSLQLIFDRLEDMDAARAALGEHAIRYRTGKTLVPFRLTGNLDWGLTAPEVEGLGGLTFWVWPESLWAPISFTAAYLEQQGGGEDDWKDWWCAKDARVYQFIGEDNVFFYGLPEMAMFMGMQGENPEINPPEGQLQIPLLIANRFFLFLDKKASSSGAVKPPMARDLLDYYTADQLRIHFFSLGLGIRSMSFRPKPLNPKAGEKDGDPVLKEGNLLSNTLNRAVRSCFYTAQKFYDGRVPAGEVSVDVLRQSEEVILDFEAAMFTHEFHQTVVVAGRYIRDINQQWSRSKPYDDNCDPDVRRQAVIDAFHMVRVATVLMHSIAPEGTEKVREYLGIGEDFWCWDRIFEPLYAFMDDPAAHRLKFLAPRVDFFEKHPSQIPT